ncbi:hypothetical protein K488DRAFT_54691, partial [Vararia minispora EC-137]
HTSRVQALTPLRDSPAKLASAGADCSVRLYDLGAERVVSVLRPSNSAYGVHAVETIASTVLLEVAHKELQYELRDYRLVPVAPVIRFGFDAACAQGRYARGALNAHMFAAGGADGVVRVWDVRRCERPLQTVRVFSPVSRESRC